MEGRRSGGGLREGRTKLQAQTEKGRAGGGGAVLDRRGAGPFSVGDAAATKRGREGVPLERRSLEQRMVLR